MKGFHKFAFLGTLMTWCFLLAFPSTSSSAIIRHDGPYEGKVIDAETGEPIEGAVVLGVWYRIHPNVAGWNSEFYDATETLTDENGDFSIPGLGLLVFSNIDTIDILIFKAGYEHLGRNSWNSLKKDLILREKIKWRENKAIIPLKKWGLDKRTNRFGSYYVNIPIKNKQLLNKEIEKEMREINQQYGGE
jgi:hypothetical protein